MLKLARQTIINTLWHRYRQSTTQMQLIDHGLKRKDIQTYVLDHFAIIDLPGPYTGIGPLNQLFSTIGYIVQGQDYLPDKQNDFLWMTETGSHHLPAVQVLPQVVIADFRLAELPPEVRRIIEKYAQMASPLPITKIKQLAECVACGDRAAVAPLANIITHYLAGRDWPLPTTHEFRTVQAFNELLAWVLIFGRCPNHFTLSIHHLPSFANMTAFHHFIENELHLTLNHEGGKIKGGTTSGIAQGSTNSLLQRVSLSDGYIDLPTGFVEFVWRYPRDATNPSPTLWNDYFTGFIAQYADHVIESLYLTEKEDNLCEVQGRYS